jgi:hypothetical protein
MQRLLTTLVFVLTASLIVQAEDLLKYLRDTQDLARAGEYEEAAERYLWFHNHVLEHEPAMNGVRLSSALMSWKELGDVYPPALASIKKVRNEKTDILVQKNGNRHLFHDVAALNNTLEEDAKTIELFRILDKEQPDLAKQCWRAAKDAVITGKAYDLVRKYIGNPVREWDTVKKIYEMNKTRYDDESKTFGDQFKKITEEHFVQGSLKLIELALALDDTESAKEIQAKALATFDDYRLKDAIPKVKE